MITDKVELVQSVKDKVFSNKQHRDLLILLNQEPNKALHEIRELYQDENMFSNYETMLENSERPVAIRNMVNRIVEQIKANNEAMLSMVTVDLSSIKESIKERYKLNKITSVSGKLEVLYKILEDESVINILRNMYNLDKIKIKHLAEWFKINKEDIDTILEYDITSFILDTETITVSYIDQSLEILEMGNELEIEFTDQDGEVFTFKSIDTSTVSPIENIKYLVETNIGLEPKVEIVQKQLLESILKFKPSKVSFNKITKLVEQSMSDYNDNKITAEAYKELNRNYDNIITTYFNIFALRLITLSSFVDKTEEVVDNLNRVVSDIEYLQNSLK